MGCYTQPWEAGGCNAAQHPDVDKHSARAQACPWAKGPHPGTYLKNCLQVQIAGIIVIPQEGESITAEATSSATAEEAGAGKSIWAQLPVAKLHKKSQWGSSPQGRILVGSEGMTSGSPIKAGCDLLCILVGLLLLVFPGNGMWDGEAGRGGHLSWESWKFLQ